MLIGPTKEAGRLLIFTLIGWGVLVSLTKRDPFIACTYIGVDI